MPGTDRLPLVEAAGRWLDSSSGRIGDASTIRTALENFVSRRYRGAAKDLRRIHELRQGLLGEERPLSELVDAAPGPWDQQTLGEAASHSATPDQGRLLFHLVRARSPRQILELGTNIGISAAYLATGLRYTGGGSLTTIEASGIRLGLARGYLRELDLGDVVTTLEGYFDDVLEKVVKDLPHLDMAFIDGNHRLDATLRYFEVVVAAMEEGGLAVLDDIRWSEEMWEAWQSISRSSSARIVVDLGRTGLVVTG